MSTRPPTRFRFARALLIAATLTAGLEGLLASGPAAAQVESFINQRGSNVGPATKVVPTDCVQAADGSLTCGTKIENSPSDTPAKPQFSPFKN